MTLKLLSWNVNGLRAAVNKGFYDVVDRLAPDVLCLQEIKLSEGQIDLQISPDYHQCWNYAAKKGYSGTALFCKEKPLSVEYNLPADISKHVIARSATTKQSTTSAVDCRAPLRSARNDIIEQLSSEGRIITAEFADYYVITCYTPNSQDGLARIEPRLLWGQCFTAYVEQLQQTKPVIICGDLNVAHRNIDLKNDKTNHNNAGFSNQERGDFANLLAKAKLVDSFRYLYPSRADSYSWWSYRGNARANNAGWRIDYWLVSQRITNKVKDSVIYSDIVGSDHCPVELVVSN